MIFHSIVFSLADPQKNEYIYMLMLLVHSLYRKKTFVPKEDKYYVMADAATLEVLRSIPLLGVCSFLEIPKPTDCYDGMRFKYQLFDYVEPCDDVVMYLDVDMLCRRQARFVIPADTLYVFPEGAPTDTNYCGDPGTPLEAPAGATAGFFMYRFGDTIKVMFENILERLKTGRGYYTLDQPHFNHSLQGRASFLPGTLISFNGNNNPQAHFINAAGCPGDGPFHFRKMLEFALIFSKE